jgi:hypothetical protein
LPPGPQGPAGAPGTQVQLTSEPPGKNCSAGGERIDIGVAADGGFVVRQTAYVCNGIGASQPDASASRPDAGGGRQDASVSQPEAGIGRPDAGGREGGASDGGADVGGACAAHCTDPPASSCVIPIPAVDLRASNTLTTYSDPGSCDSNGNCVYLPATTTCSQGCYLGTCNTTGPSFVSLATASVIPFTSPGLPLPPSDLATATLDEVPRASPESGIGLAAASATIDIQIQVTPSSAVQEVFIEWSINDFTAPYGSAGNEGPIQQSGGVDTFEFGICPCAPGTNVTFYIYAIDWSGNVMFSPDASTYYQFRTE